MYKLLVVTENFVNTKEFINNVVGKVSSLQIVGIATNLEEFKNHFMKNVYFDFILFHKCTFDEYEEIIEKVSGIICVNKFKTLVKRYEKRISISTKNSDSIIQTQMEKFAKKITLNNIRQQAVDILLELGFNFKHIGSKYLVDAICYSYSRFDDAFENLEKEIYPYIARVNKTHVENVKWSLSRTINLMYQNHTTKSVIKLEEYFYLDRFEKPTPKLVIGTITNNLLATQKI